MKLQQNLVSKKYSAPKSGGENQAQVPTSGDSRLTVFGLVQLDSSRDLDSDGFEEIGGFPRSSGAQEEPEGRQGPKGPLRALKGPGRAKWPLKGQGPKGPLRALKGPLRAGLMWTLLSTMWL